MWLIFLEDWCWLGDQVVAVTLWGHKLIGKKIVLRCDNESVVSIINKQTSKCPQIMALVRFMVLRCLKSNLQFCTKHVPGIHNKIADSLSRFQMTRFWEVDNEQCHIPHQSRNIYVIFKSGIRRLMDHSLAVSS